MVQLPQARQRASSSCQTGCSSASAEERRQLARVDGDLAAEEAALPLAQRRQRLEVARVRRREVLHRVDDVVAGLCVHVHEEVVAEVGQEEVVAAARQVRRRARSWRTASQ